MQITLTRIGGMIPMIKEAQTEVDWTEDELNELLTVIESKSEGQDEKRDATGYELTNNAGTFSIDLDKVPAKFKKTFEELQDNLKIVKPGK